MTELATTMMMTFTGEKPGEMMMKHGV